jgi:hypothetical protein
MSGAKYQTPEHRAAKAQYRKDIDEGNGWCAEPVCKMASRFIPPGSRFHASHDPSGTRYIGPSHPACNTSEGASRGNRARGGGPDGRRRWAL